MNSLKYSLFQLYGVGQAGGIPRSREGQVNRVEGISRLGYPTGHETGISMLKSSLRSPATAFAMLALVTFMIIAGSALWTAHVPGARFHVRPAGDEQVRVDVAGTAGGQFHGRQEAVFIDRNDHVRLRTPLIAMVMEWEPRSTKEENRRFFTMRDELTRLVREPGMRMLLPDGRYLPAQRVEGSLGQMKSGTWLALAIGFVAMLTGLWVMVLRPREWTARMFLLSGFTLMIATITMAIGEQMSVATSIPIQYWTGRINHLAAYMFGMSLVALFARYPLPLVSRRMLASVAVALALFWVVILFDPWEDAFGKGVIIVLVLGVAIVLFALVQGWKSRHDPALRAAFILIGGSLLFCVGVFSFVNLIPQMLGEVDVLSVPVATTVFLLFYLALAVAITRYRLFDLGNWAFNVAIAALVVISVLIVDFVLVLLVGGTWTISLAFLTAAICWLPLRELLLRRGDRRRDRRDMLLLRGASEVAFALKPEQQLALWARLLEEQFSPLTVEPSACAAVEIRSEGRILAVPSPLGGPGLELNFAGQGRRLFNSGDKSVASALVSLVQEMIEARAAYDRGVQAERHRIARDLHDDVGARLMTTLHRDDIGTVHAEVREAMADMRLIIDGMSGQTRSFSDIIADLRHETVSRLRLAHINARWSVDALFDDERPVQAAQNRALFSVVRELVSNIIRHACADEVKVSSELNGDHLSLFIHDNGKGFDAADSAHIGNGLRNTRKRLEEIKGSMAVTSDSSGTVIRIQLPLGSHEQGMAAHVHAS